MERLDFASIMAVLRRNISEDLCPNQLDLIEALFRDMGYNPDACMEFDNGLVCRWMNGLAKLSPKITTFYQDNYNQRKEYLCIRDGEERGFTGLEFKSAQKEGWEKQYQYKVGRKKEYMTPSAAEAAGYERASKTPKSTRFGRQNPIAARWNSDEQLVLWRSAWADVTNRHLERIGAEARIDHRSHADRGMLEQPTVHVGVAARAMERQGITADRCELNRQIRADNAFLRELRKQVEKIAQAVMDTIPAIAKGMESLRQKMVIYRYQFLHFRSARWQVADELRDVKPDLKRFDELVAEIKSKTRERKRLTDEKKQIPVWNLLKKNELTKRITQLTEELEELRSEKTRLLARFAYTEDKEMKQAKDWAKLKEKTIDDLSTREKQCEAALDDALAEFQQLSQKADAHDPDELWVERLNLRETVSRDTKELLKSRFGSSFSPLRLQNAQKDVGMYLEQDEQSLRRYADWQRRREQEIRRAQKAQTPQKRDYER